MKTKQTDQMRWVVLLLATAVILPTICLLWFMTQAVKNERLAVRQKLLDICGEAAGTLKNDLIKTVAAQAKNYQQSSAFVDTLKSSNWVGGIINNAADSVVVYDNEGKLIYPVYEDNIMETAPFSEPLAAAFSLEQKGDVEKALKLYTAASDPDQPSEQLFAAYTGQLRCLEKQGRAKDVFDVLEKLLYSQREVFEKKLTRQQVAMLWVRMFEFLGEHKEFHYSTPFDTLGIWYTYQAMYSAETSVWMLKKYIDVAATLPYPPYRGVSEAGQLLDTITLAMTGADFLDAQPVYKERPVGMWFAVPTEPRLYILPVMVKEHTLFFLKTSDNFMSSFEPLLKAFPIRDTLPVAYDNLGQVVYGRPPAKSVPFLTSDLSGFSEGWRLELYFDSDDPFSAAADRQAAIYKWTGVLVVALMLLAGAVAIRAVGRQIQMNRLKNDFIATVTHELKTPLSSMRLLVETLLDGGYTDQPRCREYLELICRENHRLSRMIDSFLTFSRMERAKQVFEMQPVSPAEIAQAAAEAVQAKFQEKKCRFSVTADEGLASIYADKDAMVTVLVNLLDNACKYSGDDKQIALRVFAQDGGICFSVADNGIGMTRRQMRRIFDKFYQADTSLARRTEGCGMGLSIVKYILDAHNATITADSKLGKGSVFTVIVPCTSS